MPRRSSPMPSRPQTPTPATARPARKTKPRRKPAKSLPDLDRVARRLEADWQAALHQHEAAVHRQFRDLRTALRGRRGSKLKGKDAATLREALEPRLKPKRGRAKDLRRVEDALGQALENLP